MEKIYLTNTLGREKQEFIPLKDGEVSIYTCGPTVYNYLHIGNLRAYTFADILKRVFLYNGYKVRHIMQVTDIGHIVADADMGEDKMVSAIAREGKSMTLESMREVAEFYFARAKEDMEKLRILPADSNPFASDHIAEDITIIEDLLEKKIAYITDQAIYFDTKKFPNYGVLGGAVANDDHSRIGKNSDKRSPEDFALWKFSDISGIGFEAPFGKGFPGWHIECSAMSMKYLGETLDIHTGGIDLIPIHHNNEIAQSESHTGQQFVRYWMHNGHITLGDAKMAKTGGNFLTLGSIEKLGIRPSSFRYWLLTSKYSTRIDYSIEALKAAQTADTKLVNFMLETEEDGEINKEYKERFTEAVNDDLDTPKALALVWELVKNPSVSGGDKKATLLDFDRVLGLGLSEIKDEKVDIPNEVQKLLEERDSARKAKDWEKSDLLREEILKLGFDIKDTADGQKAIKI